MGPSIVMPTGMDTIMGIDGLMMKIARGLSCTYAAKASTSAIETAVTISGQVNTYRIYAY